MKQDARLTELSALDGIALGGVVKRLGLKRKDVARALGVTEGAVSLGFNDPGGPRQFRKDMRKKIIDFISDFEQKSSLTKKSKRNLRAA